MLFVRLEIESASNGISVADVRGCYELGVNLDVCSNH